MKADATDADDRRDDGRRVEDETEEEGKQAFESGIADDGREKEGKTCEPARDPAYRKEIVLLLLQQVFHRLFPPDGGGRILFRVEPLSADELVARHAVELCKHGEHGDIGAGSARLPARHRLVGDAEGICDLLLGISF